MRNEIAVILFSLFSISAAIAGDVPSYETCASSKMATAPSGYTCSIEGKLWKVENETYIGKRVYRDVTSGLKITEPLDGLSDQYSSGTRCSNGYRLSSGYPSELKGKYGFPNKDSEVAILGNDYFRWVVPGVMEFGKFFWSSSIDPTSSVDAFYFSGNDDVIGYSMRDYKAAIICISGP